MMFWNDCWQRLVSMVYYRFPFDLLHFMSLWTIYVSERNVEAYCHAFIYGYRTKVGKLVQVNLYNTSKLFF